MAAKSENMEDFKEEFLKKDEDAQFSNETDHSITVTSKLLEDEIEKAIENPKKRPTAIPVRILRHIFVVNTIFAWLTVLGGILPYYFFRTDVSVPALGWLLGVVALFLLCAFVLMALVKDMFYTVPIIGIWMALTFMFVTTLAAIMRSLAPFQAVFIVFSQSFAMVIYSYVSRRYMDSIWGAGFMAGAGLLGWLCGLYIFINENDWITSLILFLFVVLGCAAYSAYQIRLVGRFSLSRKDLVQAVVHYYTDPVFLPAQWITTALKSDLAEEEEPEL